MKKIQTSVIDLKKLARVFLLIVVSMLLSACDYWHDDLEGCEAKLRVQFVYDMNMKFADAFEHEVKTVTLHAFDKNGKLVYTKTEQAGRILVDGGMNVDNLPSGTYDLLVWAEGEERYAASYTFAKAKVGESVFADFETKVNREDKIVGHDLTPLYHGFLQQADLAAVPGETKTVTVKLTKDTNNVKVVLQHLSGKDLSADDFDFAITDNNGYMEASNALKEDDVLTYPAWSKYAGKAGVGSDSDDGTETQVSVVVAEMTTNRLVTGHNMRLKVTHRASGKVIVNIPLIDYALLVKGNYNRSMSDQEYLDRQDAYDLVFLLDEKDEWPGVVLNINSWRVVLSNADFGK